MTEKQFEKKVKAFLDEQKVWWLKTWSNGIQREGVPDLLVCCNGYFIGVELKNETGHPSALQLWNIDQIRKAGGIAMVLYPDQFGWFKVMIQDLKNDFARGCHRAWFEEQLKRFDRRENTK